MSWRETLRDLFAAPATESAPPLQLSKFDLGVCPGCRGLRAMASPACSHCGSEAPVTADA
ncbi:MAG: hypothetical protein EPO67_08900 [Reyranella sp.]|nr:MAG: hypothetical protein EPO67_08900 [Reyranella sp.]